MRKKISYLCVNSPSLPRDRRRETCWSSQRNRFRLDPQFGRRKRHLEWSRNCSAMRGMRRTFDREAGFHVLLTLSASKNISEQWMPDEFMNISSPISCRIAANFSVINVRCIKLLAVYLKFIAVGSPTHEHRGCGMFQKKIQLNRMCYSYYKPSHVFVG